MAAPTQTGPATTGRRAPLNRDRVLRAAVALADGSGIDAISMRKLAQHLGVVPMALYKHVASKEELLDGMVEAVIGEIEPPAAGPAGGTRCASGCCPPGGSCCATRGRPG